MMEPGSRGFYKHVNYPALRGDSSFEAFRLDAAHDDLREQIEQRRELSSDKRMGIIRSLNDCASLEEMKLLAQTEGLKFLTDKELDRSVAEYYKTINNNKLP